MLRILSEQLRTYAEELGIFEVQEQREELAVRALRILAVRALLRNLALRALKVKHLAYAQASLPWISSALQRPQQQQQWNVR